MSHFLVSKKRSAHLPNYHSLLFFLDPDGIKNPPPVDSSEIFCVVVEVAVRKLLTGLYDSNNERYIFGPGCIRDDGFDENRKNSRRNSSLENFLKAAQSTEFGFQ